MKCCSCGKQVPQNRVNAITLNGRFPTPSRMMCIDCAEDKVEKKAGYMPSVSKMLGEIIITSQETVQGLHKDAWRAGTGVSRGMKN